MHETLLQPEPVCPECGHRHRDAWEWDFGPGLDGTAARECDSCQAAFTCSRIVTVDYTTKRADAPKEPKP